MAWFELKPFETSRAISQLPIAWGRRQNRTQFFAMAQTLEMFAPQAWRYRELSQEKR